MTDKVFLTKDEIKNIAKLALEAMMIECQFKDNVQEAYKQSFLYYLDKQLDVVPVITQEN